MPSHIPIEINAIVTITGKTRVINWEEMSASGELYRTEIIISKDRIFYSRFNQKGEVLERGDIEIDKQ